MTPEETASDILSGIQLIDNTYQEACQVKLELATLIAQALHKTMMEEREACARLAEVQAEDIRHELPDASGGAWAKRFGRNVALTIAGAIRTRERADR